MIHISTMHRAIRLFVFAGVIWGLFGQGMAAASTPCAMTPAMMAAQQMTTASDQMANCGDCDKGSDKNKLTQDTPSCCAHMAGIGSIAMTDIRSFQARTFVTDDNVHSWAPALALVGREIPPEQAPPLNLG